MKQKPEVEKLMKMLARQVAKSNAMKNDACIIGIIDLFYSEMEHAVKVQNMLNDRIIEWDD
eukprot:2021579-Ditylum_brightwellii.AAC.1